MTKKGEGEPKVDEYAYLLEDEETEQVKSQPRIDTTDRQINLKNVDPIDLPNVENVVDGLLKDYPLFLSDLGLPFRIKCRLNNNNFGTTSAGFKFKRGKLILNYHIELGKFFRDLNENENEIWFTLFSDGSQLIKVDAGKKRYTTISHEYGHLIDITYSIMKHPEKDRIVNWIKNNFDANGNAISNYYYSLASSEEYKMFMQARTRHTLSNEIFSELQKEYSLSEYEMQQRCIKEYGKYSMHVYSGHGKNAEFMSEAFANMRHLKDEDKTDFMRSFERIFNKKYKEAFGG